MKKLRRILSAFLVAATLATAAAAVPAQAVTNVTASKYMSTARTVKTKTTYKVHGKVAGNRYYIKFKAPSSGTYKFNFTAMKFSNGDNELGNFYVGKNTGYGFSAYTIRTQGGRTQCMFMSTYGWWRQFYHSQTGKNNYRYSRYAIKKLSKGQTVYLQTWTTGSGKYTYQVRVNKQ